MLAYSVLRSFKDLMFVIFSVSSHSSLSHASCQRISRSSFVKSRACSGLQQHTNPLKGLVSLIVWLRSRLDGKYAESETEVRVLRQCIVFTCHFLSLLTYDPDAQPAWTQNVADTDISLISLLPLQSDTRSRPLVHCVMGGKVVARGLVRNAEKYRPSNL